MAHLKGKKAKQHIQEAAVQRKRARALELRLEGKTQRQIAAEMRCAVSTVNDYLTSALQDIPRELAEDVRHRETCKLDAREQRCNEASRAVLKILRRKSPADDKTVLDAVARLFDGERTLNKIAERRARLLGLDAPEVHELGGIGGGIPLPVTVVNVDASPAEAARLVREAFGSQAAKGSPDVRNAEPDAEPALPVQPGSGPIPAESGEIPSAELDPVDEG